MNVKNYLTSIRYLPIAMIHEDTQVFEWMNKKIYAVNPNHAPIVWDGVKWKLIEFPPFKQEYPCIFEQ